MATDPQPPEDEAAELPIVQFGDEENFQNIEIITAMQYGQLSATTTVSFRVAPTIMATIYGRAEQCRRAPYRGDRRDQGRAFPLRSMARNAAS